jgi:hypothetical protein
MPDNQETEVDKLQDIMESLPDSVAHDGPNRREYSLTKGDVLLIYRIAKVANQPHACPFPKDEVDTLTSVAKNVNRTQKLASGIIIMGLVSGVLTGMWFAIKHIITEFVHNGGAIK